MPITVAVPSKEKPALDYSRKAEGFEEGWRPASDHFVAVAVDCYAGAQGDETPRRVTRGDQLVEILAVVAQWRTPDHRYFRVRTADESAPCARM